jgi:hypothetical protein
MARTIRLLVFQFLAFDRETRRYSVFPRYATREAVSSAHGILRPDTGAWVTLHDVDFAGYVSILRSISLRSALRHSGTAVPAGDCKS